MGVTITGDFTDGARLEVLLEQRGDKAKKHAIEYMREEALEVALLAEAYAPRDKGMLERAIEVDDAGGGRDERGRLQRKTVVVYVNPNAPGSGGQETVEDYGYLMHEGQTPEGGAYGLGPGSLEKATASGMPVGGGFLRRALQDRAKIFVSNVSSIFRKYF